MLALLLLCFAPAPFDRHPRPASITPGTWVQVWQSGKDIPHDYQVTLSKDGTWLATDDYQVWRGTWEWNHRTRVLSILESRDSTELYYSIKLDHNFEGSGFVFDYSTLKTTPIKLKLKRVP